MPSIDTLHKMYIKDDYYEELNEPFAHGETPEMGVFSSNHRLPQDQVKESAAELSDPAAGHTSL